MVKKKVPDWLNSSLWTTTPSSSSSSSSTASDDRPKRHSPKVSTATTESLVQPPVPVSPPTPPTREEPPHPSKSEIKDKDSRSRVSVSSNNSDNKEDGDDNNDTAVAGPSAEDISRQAQLLTELSRKVINMRELRRIASMGIPDGAGIRSTVWKLLLGYLPPDRSLWPSELARKRSQYQHFKEELLMNPVCDFGDVDTYLLLV